jgi:indole-3-glycerol phosphate synthase
MVKAVPDILAQIVEHKKAELCMRQDDIEARAAASTSGRREFSRALKASTPSLIAEIKKASPSRGVLAVDFDAPATARAYERGGAAALSVLTDSKYFQGRLADLEAARDAVSIPTLRKDFTIDPYHVREAAAHGADAILLIAAILTDREMRDFRELAEGYRMDAIVEVHDEDELNAAMASGAGIIGVNNRNLHTFEVSLETSLHLAEKIPSGVVRIAESGIHSHTDVARLSAAGYHAFLVGEHLMKSPDPALAVRGLLE